MAERLTTWLSNIATRGETSARASAQAVTLLQQLPDVVFRTDAAGRWHFLNDGWQVLTGFAVEESLGTPWVEYLHPRDRERCRAQFDALLDGSREEMRGVLRLLDRDGEPHWLEVRARAARQEGGVVGTLANVTTRVQEEELLQASHRTLRALIDEVPGMIYRCRNNPHWTMEYVSGGCEELTGYRPEDIVDNRTVSYASLILPDDQQQVWNDVQASVRERQRFDLVYRIQTREGAQKWVWERGKGVFSASGDLLGLEGFMTDITLAERRRREQRRDALYDPRTRLPGELLFRDRLQVAVERARREPDFGYALLKIGLDRFARLRSRFGDDLSERVALDVARRLSLALGPDDSLCRLQEERFACLLPGRSSVAEVTALASRLREQLRTPIAIGDSTLYVTISIGIAQSDTGYAEADEVLRDADTAMSRAHAQGGARHELFDLHLHARAAALQVQEQELRQALEGDELLLAGAALADCTDGSVRGRRLALAWCHPRRGRLRADDFLGAVADDALLEQLRERFLQLLTETAEEASCNGPQMVCVDVPQPLLNAELVSRLASAWATAAPGRRLLLALGESSLARWGDALAANVAGVGAQHLGLLLAPFDFHGDALRRLRLLPVQAVALSPARYAGPDFELARALVALAHELGLRVLATEVDHDLRLAQARAAGCDLHQGALAGPGAEATTASGSKHGDASSGTP